MNDKIKQLADDAGINYQFAMGASADSVTDLQLEEFAELIVAECLDYIDTMERIAHASNASIPDDYDEYTYLKTLDVLKGLIKSQFGVDE
jgi:hypothetical protein